MDGALALVLVHRLEELVLAFALLLRLPAPRIAPARELNVGDYAWAFPLAGLVVGSIGGIVLWGVRYIGADPPSAALAAIAATMLATGALHEDGLADFSDGIGGGRTRARKLEIMRDSAVGSFGVCALFVVLGLRWAALSRLADPAAAVGALIVTHTAARGMLPLMLEYWRPARADGLAAATRSSLLASAVSILIAAMIAFAYAAPSAALAALLVAALSVLVVGSLASRYLGGYTGDVLGAAEQTAEALGLAIVAGLLSR